MILDCIIQMAGWLFDEDIYEDAYPGDKSSHA